MASIDDELDAFQAEMSKLSDAPKTQTTAGPRAPQVISAAPSRPAVEESVTESAASASSRLLASIDQSSSSKKEAGSSATESRTSSVPSYSGYRESNAPEPSSSGYVGASTSSYRPPAPPVEHHSKKESKKGEVAAPKAKVVEQSDPTKRFCAGQAWEDKTLADWPEDDFRIFVGDLGNETNDDVLAHAFARYPSFQKARVVRNKNTQKSMGYGFVSFKDPWDMTKALREMPGKYIGNRPVKVRKSTWKERSETDKEWNHSMAVSDKKLTKKLKDGQQKKKPHVSKKQKGMPW